MDGWTDGWLAGRPPSALRMHWGGNEASLREGTARVIMSVSDCDIA